MRAAAATDGDDVALAAVVGGEPVNLLETLAQRIADALLASEGVRMVAVTVHKPGAPIDLEFADVSVTIRRSRPDAWGPRSGESSSRNDDRGTR